MALENIVNLRGTVILRLIGSKLFASVDRGFGCGLSGCLKSLVYDVNRLSRRRMDAM